MVEVDEDVTECSEVLHAFALEARGVLELREAHERDARGGAHRRHHHTCKDERGDVLGAVRHVHPEEPRHRHRETERDCRDRQPQIHLGDAVAGVVERERVHCAGALDLPADLGDAIKQVLHARAVRLHHQLHLHVLIRWRGSPCLLAEGEIARGHVLVGRDELVQRLERPVQPHLEGGELVFEREQLVQPVLPHLVAEARGDVVEMHRDERVQPRERRLVVGGELVEEALEDNQLERLLQLLENNLVAADRSAQGQDERLDRGRVRVEYHDPVPEKETL
mmetsp:Transcript_49021/g.115758  ORF Transcript_49021/g.115758 Transcript_49021/m.115758 type:complete len:280 (+) Transcript_49021:323-1162(+)